MDTEGNGVRIFAPGGMVALAMSPWIGANHTQANANLIAAAPEMYEALYEIAHELASRTDLMGLSDMIGEAATVLAKARGEK
jgi:hypothetical protein